MHWFWILLLSQLVLVDKLIFISTVFRFLNNGITNLEKKKMDWAQVAKKYFLRLFLSVVSLIIVLNYVDHKYHKYLYDVDVVQVLSKCKIAYSLDSHLECVIRVVHSTRLFIFENSTYTERCLLIGCSSGASCIHPHYLLLIGYPQLLLNNINIYVLHTLYKPQPLIGERNRPVTGLKLVKRCAWKRRKAILLTNNASQNMG